MLVLVTIAAEVRALRAALNENTATFGARWRRSGRTVEQWEQGRREPDAFVLENMRLLATRRKKPGQRAHKS
jgi:DNA-binding transcriptional regulator YiaG